MTIDMIQYNNLAGEIAKLNISQVRYFGEPEVELIRTWFKDHTGQEIGVIDLMNLLIGKIDFILVHQHDFCLKKLEDEWLVIQTKDRNPYISKWER